MNYFGHDVRPYGHPGKFEGEPIFAEHLHAMTLDGWCDDETGDAGSIGWFGLIITNDAEPFTNEMVGDMGNLLTEGELAALNSPYGWIVSEDSNGFVSVTEIESRADWDLYTNEVAARYGDEDETEDVR